MDPDPEFLLNAIPLTQLIRLGILFLLLLCSALVSGSEVALFSVSKVDLDVDEEDEDFQKLNIVKVLLHKPKKLLATILVVNNFINIGIVLLFDSLGAYFLRGIDVVLWGWLDLHFFTEVVLVTFLILLFGEILPKIYAARNNVLFVTRVAYPLRFLNKILFFINEPMRFVTLRIHSQFGEQKSEISVSHLSHALEVTSDKDTSFEEKKILQGIVSFGNTEVRQVMCPRTTVFCLSKDEPFLSAVDRITKEGFSRVPVYEDSIDNVIGVLYVKDLLLHLDKEKFDWSKLVRKTLYIPENKKLDDLLTEFKERKKHIAIVVDEYGGTSGLITMDDIIAEIVGDISDEFDDEDLIYTKIDVNNYLFDGRTHLKDFYKVTKIIDSKVFDKFKGEAETLAGFLLEISNVLPVKGKKIIFKDYIFLIESVDKKRIKKIKFTKLNAK